MAPLLCGILAVIRYFVNYHEKQTFTSKKMDKINIKKGIKSEKQKYLDQKTNQKFVS